MILLSLPNTTVQPGRSLKTWLAKAFLLLAFFLLPALSAHAQEFQTPSSAQRSAYAKEFAAQFPAGTDYNTASDSVFAEAVQKTILAHPPEQAAAIAYAITSVVKVDRAKEVAEAIAKLFGDHPALEQQVSVIAQAMTAALQTRIGAVASTGDNGDSTAILPLGDNPAITDQVNAAISDVLSVFSLFMGGNSDLLLPPGVQPGEIQTHETPVVNL